MSAVTDLFTNIANAIRGKKGTVDPIPAADFISEIASIPLGDPKPSIGILQTEWNVNGYPTKYEVYGIPTIPDQFFRYSLNYANRYVQTIVLDETVTAISDFAFRDCAALTQIALPPSLISMGTYAFSGCGFSQITLPASLTTIGSAAFRNCLNLTSLTIPKSVTEVGSSNGFIADGCTSLTQIVLEEGMTTIPDSLFRFCYLPINITIPSTVTRIGGYAFLGCTSLTSITIPKSVTSIGGAFSVAFGQCDNLATAIFEDGMTAIPSYALRECTGLVSAVIPPTVNTINSYAFYSCPKLTTVSTLGGIGSPVVSISTTAFASCPLLTALTVYTTGGAALAGAPWGATNATITYLSA